MTEPTSEPPPEEQSAQAGATVVTDTDAGPATGAADAGAAVAGASDAGAAAGPPAATAASGHPTAADASGQASHPVAGGHGAHPSEAQYILVALILAVLTAIEVGVSYAKRLGDAAAPLLIILAITKFVMVVGFFMHLRYDSHILRRIFATGVALALVVYFIVFFTLGVFSGSHGVHS
jgi:cytochrome c oxidase subunit 4